MRIIIIFIESVAHQGWTLAAGVSTVIAIFGLWSKEPFGVPRKWFWRATLALVFIACYFAWRDQYQNVGILTTANQQLSRLLQEEKNKNEALSSQVTALQAQLAEKQKSPTLTMRASPSINQRSSGDNSPNTAIIGNQNQVTINPTVHARKLTSEQVTNLQQAAKAYPSKIRIYYAQNDGEGYQIAKQIYDALVGAGWMGPPVQPVIPVSQVPIFGMELSWKGDMVTVPDEMISVSRTSPQGAVAVALIGAFPDDFRVNRFPDLDSDTLKLMVYPNPASKPQ